MGEQGLMAQAKAMRSVMVLVGCLAIIAQGSMEQDSAVAELGASGANDAKLAERTIEQQVRTEKPDAAAFDVDSADQANRIDAALMGEMGTSMPKSAPASQANTMQKELDAIENTDADHAGVSMGETIEGCGDEELGEGASAAVKAGCEKKRKARKKVSLMKKSKRNKVLEKNHKKQE